MLVTDTQQIQGCYSALVERDKDQVGTFFAGVKTTGIFCIATCSARKPKFENVEFYTAFKDALDAGYRPCKICKPTENAFAAPLEICEAIAWVREHPKERLGDWQLKQMGLSPERIRRWFQKTYGMSFQGFQRSLRINAALEELKDGRTATARETNVLRLHRFNTPLGLMFVCGSDNGVCLLEFVHRRMLETEFCDVQRLLRAKIVAGENKHTRQAELELSEYFAGKRRSFDLSLDTPGSDFQKAAWAALQTIPYGSKMSYAEHAEKIGNPQAVRAVAGANGANRVAIVVPCHRLVGKDGALTGYGGGLERKQWLLDHESKEF